jgi:hypothetical protein
MEENTNRDIQDPSEVGISGLQGINKSINNDFTQID